MSGQSNVIELADVDASRIKFTGVKYTGDKGTFSTAKYNYVGPLREDRLYVNLGKHKVRFYKVEPNDRNGYKEAKYKLRISIDTDEEEKFLGQYINFYISILNAFLDAVSSGRLGNLDIGNKRNIESWQKIRSDHIPITPENYEKNGIQIGTTVNEETGEKSLYFDATVNLQGKLAFLNTIFYFPLNNGTCESVPYQGLLNKEFDAIIRIAPYDVFINSTRIKARMSVYTVYVCSSPKEIPSLSKIEHPVLPHAFSVAELEEFKNFCENSNNMREEDSEAHVAINSENNNVPPPISAMSVAPPVFPSAQPQFPPMNTISTGNILPSFESVNANTTVEPFSGAPKPQMYTIPQ